MKILSIDYGKSKSGLAFCDTTLGVVFPRGTVRAASLSEILETLQTTITESKIELIVVGIPYYPSRSTTSGQEEETIKFIELLKDAVSVPVDSYDERLTTKIAQQNRQVFTKRKAKITDDELAAVVLLENYLDAKKLR